jgi:hypothetical protein
MFSDTGSTHQPGNSTAPRISNRLIGADPLNWVSVELTSGDQKVLAVKRNLDTSLRL